jgi:hypothetical protein
MTFLTWEMVQIIIDDALYNFIIRNKLKWTPFISNALSLRNSSTMCEWHEICNRRKSLEREVTHISQWWFAQTNYMNEEHPPHSSYQELVIK